MAGRVAAPVEHPLSQRELDVARAVARGLSNQEICEELFVSLSTVKTHLASIQTKLRLRNRVEVAIWVHDRQLQ
jgi:DNA-binding NarL/FixJ family response regulator